MPSVGRFLELLEAVSRRDMGAVSQVVQQVVEDEKKKKHFTAAHQLLQALEVATSDAGYDRVGTMSLTSPQPVAAPPVDFVMRIETRGVSPPVLPSELERAVKGLIAEWQQESRLREAGLDARHTILMYGPPGSGKTHIARHLAEALGMPLYLVRFDGIVSSYLGETASNLARVFEFVAQNRCVLLLDEIDAIAKLRDDRNELGELKRVVISLLQSIDYAGTRSLLVAATNHPHLLDPALWRRFQVVWEVPLPPASLRLKILDRSIIAPRGHALDELLGEVTEGFSGADMVRIATDAKRRVALEDELQIGEAILLGIVERLRTPNPSSESDKKTDEVLTRLALALRKVGGERAYSFNNLERLTGIAHSTLHHRARAAS